MFSEPDSFIIPNFLVPSIVLSFPGFNLVSTKFLLYSFLTVPLVNYCEDILLYYYDEDTSSECVRVGNAAPPASLIGGAEIIVMCSFLFD